MPLITPKIGNNFSTAYNVPVSERSLHQFVLHSDIFEPVMKIELTQRRTGRSFKKATG